MECFAKIVKGLKLLTIFARRLILDVWQSPGYTSVIDHFEKNSKKLNWVRISLSLNLLAGGQKNSSTSEKGLNQIDFYQIL